MQRRKTTTQRYLRYSVRSCPEDQDAMMSRPRPTKNHYGMGRSDRLEGRPLDLLDLAYECEGLVIRDPRLPHALVRALLDVANGLRNEAERRSGE
jgi:hypothetical protein